MMLLGPHPSRRQLVCSDVACVLVGLAWSQIVIGDPHLLQLLVQVAFDLDEVDDELLSRARQQVLAYLGDGDVTVDWSL